MTEKLVKIRGFCDIIEANFAKQTLDDYEIKAVLENQNTASIFAGLCALSKINLYVNEDKTDQAVKILDASEKQNKTKKDD